MKRFRGTDVGLGFLAIAVNVGLVVALVVWLSGRNDEPPLPNAASPTNTASQGASSTRSPSPSTGPAAVLARTAPITIAVLGDQTSDGKTEWVSVMAELLGRDRQVTLHQLDPEDPTVYAHEQSYGSSGPEVSIYNGSRADANADYAAKRVSFLSPEKPDLVVLNYGRNDEADEVADALTSTTAAARKAWKGALVVATLQPPTSDDTSKAVRDEVAAWAKKSGVGTLDVAEAFVATGEPNAYVSSRDGTAMTGKGDRLWARTAYRLLVGTNPPEPEREPTPAESVNNAETTEPASQQQSSTPRRTTRPPANNSQDPTTADPNTPDPPDPTTPDPTTQGPEPTTVDPRPTFLPPTVTTPPPPPDDPEGMPATEATPAT